MPNETQEITTEQAEATMFCAVYECLCAGLDPHKALRAAIQKAADALTEDKHAAEAE